jgi:hypothetical protein
LIKGIPKQFILGYLINNFSSNIQIIYPIINRKEVFMGVLRIVTFLFLVSCVWSSYGLCGTKPAEVPKAKTIAELAARYDSSSCKECHEEIYEQWANSLHAYSILGTPRTAPTILTAIDKGLKLFPYSHVLRQVPFAPA